MAHWRTVKVVHNFALVFVFSIVLTYANAQSTNASLTGRLTDPSKALIVGAKIAAISVGTNIRYEVVTNSSGEFYLTNMLPGTYRIEIEKAGFKKLIKTDVALHVQDSPEINFEMTLGSASETITVEAGAPAVNTDWAAVNTVIDRSFVEHIASDADDATIVRTIIALGHNLGLKVVAEGVESDEQLRFLRSNLCDEAQGFLMGRPVSSRHLRRLFTRLKRDLRA